MNGGLWSGEYSATNHEEYWAEGVQSFCNENHYASANTRNGLQSYDNRLYSIINQVFDGTESITCCASTCDCASYQCPASVTVTPQPTPDPTPATSTTCKDNEFSFQATKPGENGWVKQKMCDEWDVASYEVVRLPTIAFVIVLLSCFQNTDD